LLCEMCPNKAFGTKFQLQNHMSRQHDPDYKKRVAGECSECGRQFESMSKLRTHMDIHSGKFS
jgi:hypothetical protein